MEEPFLVKNTQTPVGFPTCGVLPTVSNSSGTENTPVTLSGVSAVFWHSQVANRFLTDFQRPGLQSRHYVLIRFEHQKRGSKQGDPRYENRLEIFQFIH